MKTVSAFGVTAGFLLSACAGARAASYPEKPIRMVVPFTAGSATDILARLIGPKLYASWRQQVIVDNRPSAGGIVAGTIVSEAEPNGYTLMLTSSAFAGSAALYRKLPFDSIRDFHGVTQVAATPLILVVGPALGVKDLNGLLALARAKPGAVNFGSSGLGSGTHYAGELFKQVAGINVLHVPYRGSPEALNDTMAGRTEYFIAPVLSAMALVKNKRVLPLAVTGKERLPMLPDVPTAAEAGLPGYVYDGWFGVLAPSRTPRTIILALSREIARILQLPDIVVPIKSTGAIPMSSTPEAFEKLVRDEIVTRTRVFRAAGVKPR